MRVGLLSALVLAGVVRAVSPTGAVAAPVTAAMLPMTPALSGGTAEPVYYYHGRNYPYRYRGQYYNYRYNGRYYRGRSYHQGRWRYY
jgi:hypothetical protein